MKIHNVRQRSADWHALRCGIPTASQFDRIILANGKRSGQARKYMYELAYERIVERLHQGRDLSNVTHVQHGIDNEDRAVAAFEAHAGIKTHPVGFITNDPMTMGCSPDRVISTGEALEIKCPTGPVHAGYLIDGMKDAYMAQIQGQMLIGNFRQIHFFAWHEEMPPYYKIVTPDPEFLSLLTQYLDEFNSELVQGVAKIRALGHWPRNTPSVFPENDDGEGPDDAA